LSVILSKSANRARDFVSQNRLDFLMLARYWPAASLLGTPSKPRVQSRTNNAIDRSETATRARTNCTMVCPRISFAASCLPYRLSVRSRVPKTTFKLFVTRPPPYLGPRGRTIPVSLTQRFSAVNVVSAVRSGVSTHGSHRSPTITGMPAGPAIRSISALSRRSRNWPIGAAS
jgi:hypothetical protein